MIKRRFWSGGAHDAPTDPLVGWEGDTPSQSSAPSTPLASQYRFNEPNSNFFSACGPELQRYLLFYSNVTGYLRLHLKNNNGALLKLTNFTQVHPRFPFLQVAKMFVLWKPRFLLTTTSAVMYLKYALIMYFVSLNTIVKVQNTL